MDGNDKRLVRRASSLPVEASDRGPDAPSPLPPEGEGGRIPIAPDDPRAHELLAQSLREMGSGLYLFGSTARVLPQLSTMACIAYMAGVVEDAGNLGDPLERLLVEQLLLAASHRRRLLVRAEGAGAAEASSLLVASAARMFAEYRKSLLALRTLRQAPAAAAQVTLIANVEQQNVAGTAQQISMVHSGPEAPRK